MELSSQEGWECYGDRAEQGAEGRRPGRGSTPTQGRRERPPGPIQGQGCAAHSTSWEGREQGDLARRDRALRRPAGPGSCDTARAQSLTQCRSCPVEPSQSRPRHPRSGRRDIKPGPGPVMPTGTRAEEMHDRHGGQALDPAHVVPAGKRRVHLRECKSQQEGATTGASDTRTAGRPAKNDPE